MWSHFSRILSSQSRVSISEHWHKIEKFSRDHKSLGWLKFLLLLFILFILFCFKIFGWPKSEGGRFLVFQYDIFIYFCPMIPGSIGQYFICLLFYHSDDYTDSAVHCDNHTNVPDCWMLLHYSGTLGSHHPQWNQGVHSSGNIVLSLLTLKFFSMILILPSPIYVSILQNNGYLLHSLVEQIGICQNTLNMINLLNISIKLIFKYFYIKRFINFSSCFYLTQVSFNQ